MDNITMIKGIEMAQMARNISKMLTSFDGGTLSYKGSIDRARLIKDIKRGPERDLENFNNDMGKAIARHRAEIKD